jgi:hypothetical protein
MMELKGISWLLLGLASWCTAFQPRHESVSALQIITGHVQLRPCDISIRLNPLAPFQNTFCLALRGGQGERKQQRSEDKAKKSVQTSSHNKTLLKKSLTSAKNRGVQADVHHSKKLKSKSEDEISNPLSESELDFSKLTLKV